jgi:dephospho-CoA kinase
MSYTIKDLQPSLTLLSTSSRLYQSHFPIIGITGGIAMGKSALLNLFEQEGFFTISADKLVKELYYEKTTSFFLHQYFPECFDDDGNINFIKIRETIFQQPHKKKELEDFLYPQLPLLFKKKTSHLLPTEFCVYEIPLLFEKEVHPLFDITITIYCSEKTQKARLQSRDGQKDPNADLILKHQMPIEMKKKLSHFTISNEDDLSQLQKNFQDLMSQIFIKS